MIQAHQIVSKEITYARFHELGNAEIEGDKAFKGLVVSNCVLNPSRIGYEELGFQGEDEGGQLVLALAKVETAWVDEGLDDVESFPPDDH
nr:hypothetical protein CFP56_30554 [Quercus suber]